MPAAPGLMGHIGKFFHDLVGSSPNSGLGKFMASPVTQGTAMVAGSAIPVGLGVKSYLDNKQQAEQEHALTVHKKLLDIDASAHRAQFMRNVAPAAASPAQCRTDRAVRSRRGSRTARCRSGPVRRRRARRPVRRRRARTRGGSPCPRRSSTAVRISIRSAMPVERSTGLPWRATRERSKGLVRSPDPTL